MNEEYITTYSNQEIKKTKVQDNETKKFLEKIKSGYYKILSIHDSINMKGGKFHIIDGRGHRLTDKGLFIYGKIIKERKVTYYIKHLFETEDWDELRNISKGKID